MYATISLAEHTITVPMEGYEDTHLYTRLRFVTRGQGDFRCRLPGDVVDGKWADLGSQRACATWHA